MKDYSADEILEMSGWAPPGRAHVSAGAGGVTGVAMPPNGVLLTSIQARALGAQLLMAADLHDTVYEAGGEAATRSYEAHLQGLRETLGVVMNWLEGECSQSSASVLERVRTALGITALGIDPDD